MGRYVDSLVYIERVHREIVISIESILLSCRISIILRIGMVTLVLVMCLVASVCVSCHIRGAVTISEKLVYQIILLYYCHYFYYY